MQGVTIKRIKDEDTVKAVTKKAIKSEKVIKYAKKYFGCPSLTYLELEDQVNFDTLDNCHWDSRILLGEYMTSQPYLADQVISEFTLYLLEDLRFYKTNKYTGGLMKFGKKRNCKFLGYDGTVSDPSKSDCQTSQGILLSPYEFCQGFNMPTCSSGRQSRTYCVRSSNFPVDTVYTRSLGGLSWGRRNADYCPVSDVHEQDKNNPYVGNCKLGNNSYGYYITYEGDFRKNYSDLKFDESVGQIYGENSFCALSSLISKSDEIVRDDKYKERIRPTCYPMFCSDQSLTIQINNQYFVCPQKGGILNITYYDGYIYCPDYNLICSGTVLCNNMFDCVDNKSKAKEDLIYEINSNNDGSVIEGIEKNTLLPSDLQIEKGYELSENETSKCPKNCFQCIDDRRCFECETDYFYKGTTEAEGTPIKCNKTKPTDDYHYNIPDYTIFNTIKRLVFLIA